MIAILFFSSHCWFCKLNDTLHTDADFHVCRTQERTNDRREEEEEKNIRYIKTLN